MARTTHKKPGDCAGGATVGYEAQLWQMADALRGSMDAPPAGNADLAWARVA